jgi:hypothetical protein
MHHNQRYYQYGGPPSIVMGTWGDRGGVSRSQFAPPPVPFAAPPAGVPGGRISGPAASRMTAGYHSLQYTPNHHHNFSHGHVHPGPPTNGVSVVKPNKVLEKKGSVANSSTKYTRDGSDQQLHKLPQVCKNQTPDISFFEDRIS